MLFREWWYEKLLLCLATQNMAAKINKNTEKVASEERAQFYRKQCALRCKQRMQKYREFFWETLQDIEELQSTAFGGVRVARCFTMGVEYIHPIQQYLTAAEERRLANLLLP